MANESSAVVKRPSLLDAVVPLVALAVLIACALALFGLDALDGPIQVALLMCCGIAALFRAEFARRGLAPTNLSRLAADSGTVTSPLVPWNSCGAFMGATLGVSTLLYLPYAVFTYSSPALIVLHGFTGIRIEHLAPEGTEPTEEVS